SYQSSFDGTAIEFTTNGSSLTTPNLYLDTTANGQRVGIGTTASLAQLDVRGQVATIPIASFSGATTNAAEIVDQSGSGDLFTASKSGASKFTITNAGNIVAPNYAANNAVLFANPTTGLFSNLT